MFSTAATLKARRSVASGAPRLDISRIAAPVGSSRLYIANVCSVRLRPVLIEFASVLTSLVAPARRSKRSRRTSRVESGMAGDRCAPNAPVDRGFHRGSQRCAEPRAIKTRTSRNCRSTSAGRSAIWAAALDPAGRGELTAANAERHVGFATFETFAQIMTPKRLELLRHVHRGGGARARLPPRACRRRGAGRGRASRSRRARAPYRFLNGQDGDDNRAVSQRVIGGICAAPAGLFWNTAPCWRGEKQRVGQGRMRRGASNIPGSLALAVC